MLAGDDTIDSFASESHFTYYRYISPRIGCLLSYLL